MNNLLLKQRYNPEGSDLRHLQYKMLDILKIVDRICKKYNLPYWLSSGTLLGAVRHGGFIPWDDDLDVEMLREDYEKLIKILPQELPEGYVLQDNMTDSNYVYLYAKVRDTNSKIREICKVNQEFEIGGVFIDIFPIEPVIPAFKRISSVLFNRLCYNLVLKKGCWRLLYNINYWILLHVVFPIFRFLTGLKNAKDYHYIYGISFLQERRNYDDIFPLKRITFEGETFMAPNDCDAYLRKLYGDYMKLPDNIERHLMLNSGL